MVITGKALQPIALLVERRSRRQCSPGEGCEEIARTNTLLRDDFQVGGRKVIQKLGQYDQIETSCRKVGGQTGDIEIDVCEVLTVGFSDCSLRAVQSQKMIATRRQHRRQNADAA